MVNRRVLIALDGSKQSENAFQWYLENMNKPGDHVVLFHCSQFELHIGLPGVGVNVEHVTQQVAKAKERSDRITGQAMDTLKAKKIMGYVICVHGDKPHDSILNTAKMEEVNHIVMGTRDLGAVKRAFVGSVSTEVVRHATVPVTIVKCHGD